MLTNMNFYWINCRLEFMILTVIITLNQSFPSNVSLSIYILCAKETSTTYRRVFARCERRRDVKRNVHGFA